PKTTRWASTTVRKPSAAHTPATGQNSQLRTLLKYGRSACHSTRLINSGGGRNHWPTRCQTARTASPTVPMDRASLHSRRSTPVRASTHRMRQIDRLSHPGLSCSSPTSSTHTDLHRRTLLTASDRDQRRSSRGSSHRQG